MEKVNNAPEIIVCAPCDLYWASEVEIQICNFRKFGYSQHTTYLVFQSGENKYQDYWDRLAERYSEVSFYFYRNDNLRHLLAIYQPVSRPYCLGEHWRAHPELEQATILYMDSDVLFTRAIDWSLYMNDNICYLSPTDYISPTYFANKRKDVPVHMLGEYDKRDILGELCTGIGIDKQTVLDNEPHTGGCQYLLKQVPVVLWDNLLKDCIGLRIQCQQINAEFFENEDKGLQSWAIADMNGLLWNLWKLGKTTRAPKELGFSWSSSPIELYEQYPWFHNAGIYGMYHEIDEVKHKMFHKGDIRFRTSSCTFHDLVYEGISPDYCSIKYVEALTEVPDPICRVTSNYY